MGHEVRGGGDGEVHEKDHVVVHAEDGEDHVVVHVVVAEDGAEDGEDHVVVDGEVHVVAVQAHEFHEPNRE